MSSPFGSSVKVLQESKRATGHQEDSGARGPHRVARNELPLGGLDGGGGSDALRPWAHGMVGSQHDRWNLLGASSLPFVAKSSHWVG